MYIYTHVHTESGAARTPPLALVGAFYPRSPNVHVYIYIYIHIYYVYIYIYVYMLCAYTCVYIYIYIYKVAATSSPPRVRLASVRWRLLSALAKIH